MLVILARYRIVILENENLDEKVIIDCRWVRTLKAMRPGKRPIDFLDIREKFKKKDVRKRIYKIGSRISKKLRVQKQIMRKRFSGIRKFSYSKSHGKGNFFSGFTVHFSAMQL